MFLDKTGKTSILSSLEAGMIKNHIAENRITVVESCAGKLSRIQKKRTKAAEKRRNIEENDGDQNRDKKDMENFAVAYT